MNATKRVVLAGVMLALAAGCATPGRRTVTGAAAGAVVGAGVGGAAGGGRGAAIGAAVGAVAGGSVGNYLDKQAQELEKVAETQRTKDAVLVKMRGDLLFDFDEAELRPESLTQLNQVGDILAKYPEDRIRIEGHTDSIGSDSYNDELSRRRALAVRSALASRGVREHQITIVGMGEDKPVASNATADGRAANRRVQLNITVPKQPAKGS